MGMLRDDPGGHFQKGYSDGAAGKPFSPPSIPTSSGSRTSRVIPKFSENPFGWLFGILFVIYFWALWQLIKAPFQLVGSLLRSEKPSPWVIVKNVVVVGLVIALVWWVPSRQRALSQPSQARPQRVMSSSPTASGDLASQAARGASEVQDTNGSSPSSLPE